MALLPQEIIRKKRKGQELSKDDMSQFFGGFLKGDVQDYQVSSMLMAIALNGMTPEETSRLTLFMRDSGTVLNWGGQKENIVDKHSTGGVGDKTSLIIMPLCILEGLRVPMIAGRGLGHTGGTLDKLESIKGMNVFVSPESTQKLMKKNNGVFMGQTQEIAPLDRRLYAMRDVTDTVESIPLITASILSKKLSEGIGGLVMDVKFGSGAFMQKKDDALALAKSIASVGRASGVNVTCALTDMGSPLGDRAGNALEIIECIEIMKGQGPQSSRDLSVELSLLMLQLADPKLEVETSRKRLLSHLQSGRAFDKFCDIIAAQGGDTGMLENTRLLPASGYQVDVTATESGYIDYCENRELGLAVIELGGGRRQTTDQIDYGVGLSNLKRVGDAVKIGDTLATVHGNSKDALAQAASRVKDAYRIGPAQKIEPLIWRVI
ncbi:MAG: thymidine phosphorylase [Proteobacteria bacterium]|nr:thymidine phosphorylase [Pseudomonadota bacterium]